VTANEALALKNGDTVMMRGLADWRRVRVAHKRLRKDGSVRAIDLTWPNSLLKEVPLSHIAALSAIDRLGDLA